MEGSFNSFSSSQKNNFGKEFENFKSLTPFETLKLNFTLVKTLQIINMWKKKGDLKIQRNPIQANSLIFNIFYIGIYIYICTLSYFVISRGIQ